MSSLQWLPFLAGLLAATPTSAGQPSLEVAVLVIGEDGRLRPAPEDATVRLRDIRPPVRAERHGDRFKLELPGTARSPIKLQVDLKGYSLCTPAEVVASRPDEMLPRRVAVLLAEKDSLKQVPCGERIAAAVVQQMRWRWPVADRLEPAYFINDWCLLHGLEPSRLRSTVQQWASQGHSSQHEPSWRGVLSAFVNGDHAAVRTHTATMLGQLEQRMESLHQADNALQTQALRLLTLQGHAYNASSDHALALRTYERALRYVVKQQAPQAWATVMNGIGFAHAALSSSQQNGLEHLLNAADSFSRALEVYSREREPVLWASVQENLGMALMRQVPLLEAPKRLERLREAQQAYREALKVYTAEQSLLQSTAPVQESLGETLLSLAQTQEGAQREGSLREAISSFQEALAFYRREGPELQRAGLALKLAMALMTTAPRVEGEEGLHLLEQAQKAYEESLDVYTLEAQPQEWAWAMYQLGAALSAQARSPSCKRPAEQLSKAVRAYKNSLRVYTPEQSLKQWSIIQNSICNDLTRQALLATESSDLMRLEREAKNECIAHAAPTSEQALFTASRLVSLNGLYHHLAQRARAEGRLGEQARYAQEVLANARRVPQELGREQRPILWGMLQIQRGVALDILSEWAEPGEKLRLWTEEESAMREALKVFTVESAPQQWASVCSMLGTNLRNQGAWTRGEAAMPLLKQSVQILEELLSFYTAEHAPEQWVSTHEELCSARTALGARQEGAERLKTLNAAIGACNEALRILDREGHEAQWRRLKRNLYEARRELLKRSLEPWSSVFQSTQTPLPPSAGSRAATRLPPADGSSLQPSLEAGASGTSVLLPVHVLIVDQQGATGAPADSVTIWLRGSDAQVRTAPGVSRALLKLPPTLVPGDPISLGVELRDHELISPLNGESYVPEDLSSGLKLLLKPRATMAPIGADKRQRLAQWFAQEGRWQQLMARAPGLAADQTLGQDTEQAQPGSVSEEVFRAEYQQSLYDVEHHYGRELRLVLEAVDRGDPSSALMYAESAVRSREQALGRAQATQESRELSRIREELANYLSWVGNIYQSQQNFGAALLAYNRALEHTPGQYDAFLWASLNRKIGFIYTAMADLSSGERSTQYLERAQWHLEHALKVYTRDALLEEWARTQYQTGLALLILGQRVERRSAVAYLRAAVDSFRSTLQVFKDEEQYLDAAGARISLGIALTLLTALDPGEASRQDLVEAEGHMIDALGAFTRKRAPQLWALTQIHLGMTRYQLGMLESGEQARLRLASALEAFKQALDLTQREESPLDWAMLQVQLGLVLVELGVLEPGGKAAQHLDAAVDIARQMRDSPVLEEESRFQDLAESTLGMALMARGALRLEDERPAALQELSEARAALVRALEGFGDEHKSQEWARVHRGLCLTLQRLGEAQSGEPRTQLLRAAASSCQSAIPLERAPCHLATMKYSLARSLMVLARPFHGQEEAGTLEAAVGAYTEALKACPGKSLLFDPTKARAGLKEALQRLKRHQPGLAR